MQGPVARAWASGGSRRNQIPGQGSPLQGWRRVRGGNRSRVAALGGAPVFSLNCWRSPQRPQHSAQPPPHPSSSSKMARSLLDSQPQGALLPAASPWHALPLRPHGSTCPRLYPGLSGVLPSRKPSLTRGGLTWPPIHTSAESSPAVSRKCPPSLLPRHQLRANKTGWPWGPRSTCRLAGRGALHSRRVTKPVVSKSHCDGCRGGRQ